MKKMSIAKIAAASSFAAVSIVPATLWAATGTGDTVDDPIIVNFGNIEVDETNISAYTGGVDAPLDFGEMTEVKSVSINGVEGSTAVDETTHKVTIKIPVLNEAGDAVLSDAQTYDIVLNTEDAEGNTGTKYAQVQYTVTTKAADSGTDPGATDPGTTDPGATDPGTTDPGTTDPGATDPGTTDPGTTDPGTTDPGTTDPGTDPTTPTETPKTVSFETGLTVKVNGSAVESGKEVVKGDKIEITAASKRGESLKAITANSAELTLTGNSAEYTVVDGDTEIKLSATYEAIASNKVSFPENVSMTIMTDSEDIALKSGDTVYDGEKVKISATAPVSQTLTALNLNGAAIDNDKVVTVSGTDLTVTAEFKTLASVKITIPENVTVTKGTTVLKSGDTVTEGDVLKIYASKEGSTVKTLTVNGADFVSGSNYTATDKDVTIAVEFASITTATTFPVTIKVYDEDDSAVKEVGILIKDADRKTVASTETDKKGTVELDLAPGRYTYVITDIPDGYISPSGSYTITVSDDGKIKGTKTITLSSSEVVLKKVDSITKNGVAGVSIIVKNEDSETVATGTTDSRGELTIKGLAEGKYTYYERSAAAGYASDDAIYRFAIDDDGDVTGTTETTVTPISIVFTVRDYATGKGLAGATIQIKNQLGRTVATVTTDNNGEASVPGLSVGRYTLSQSEAPANYERCKDEFTFDVLASGLVSGTTSISNKEKAASSSGSVLVDTKTDNKTDTDKDKTNTTLTSTTTGDQSATSTTTGTGTTVTVTSGGKTQGTVKTGVEAVEKKNTAPIITCIVGAVGVAAVAASAVFSKFHHKKNEN